MKETKTTPGLRTSSAANHNTAADVAEVARETYGHIEEVMRVLQSVRGELDDLMLDVEHFWVDDEPQPRLADCVFLDTTTPEGRAAAISWTRRTFVRVLRKLRSGERELEGLQQDLLRVERPDVGAVVQDLLGDTAVAAE